MANKRLRILCLHGMSQNATLFRKRTEALQNEVEGFAQLVYITAPYAMRNPRYANFAEQNASKYINASEELQPRAWWFSDQIEPVDDDGFYFGARRTIEYVKLALLEQGPFDGIMGFSQGGCLAAMLTELLEDRTVIPEIMPPDFDHPPLKFVILVGAFQPRPSQTATNGVLFSSVHKIKTPSLHMIGANDEIIVPQRMYDLATRFGGPELFEHSGGHLVPSSSAARSKFASFVAKFASRDSVTLKARH